MLISSPKRMALSLTCLLAVLIGFLALLPLTVPQGVPGTDKTHHVIAFAVLILPVSVLSPRSLMLLLPVAIAYGGIIEIIQPYTGRFGEWKDFQADVVGIIIGTTVGLASRGLLLSRIRRENLS
ncbi:MAG: VanZ family protein [Rhodobacteraceae bacterium]|nr:VanZ family protein [Paracoccaceae bacterium]